jgi:hypothetical protein
MTEHEVGAESLLRKFAELPRWRHGRSDYMLVTSASDMRRGRAVLVRVNRQPQIQLDWEHTEYTWILPDEISSYETVPKLAESLSRVLSPGSAV